MEFPVNEYSARIHHATMTLNAEDLAKYVEQALSSTPEVIGEEDKTQMVGQLGERRFPRLCVQADGGVSPALARR